MLLDNTSDVMLVSMFDLLGRHALVTGGAGALGAAACRKLVDGGATVVVADLDSRDSRHLVAELGADRAMPVAMDVTDESSVAAAIDEGVAALGPIDITITAAGYGEVVSVADMRPDQWRRMIDVHLYGTFLAIHHTLSGMIERNWGRVIAFSSIASTQGVARQSHYSAAKSGIDGLVRSLAREVAPRGVTVNAIAPGYFESPLNDGAGPERLATLRDSVPVGRFGDPDEIGSLARFLSSDDAGYITGQVISPNGAFTFCSHTGD